MRRLLPVVASVCFISGAIALAAGQQAPAFEAASVKRSNANPGLFHIVRSLPGGRVTATALTLKELIRFAYLPDGIQLPDQIAGGPSWMTSDKFDVVAKAESVTTGDPDEANRQRMAMLKTLLADRFTLKVHRDVLVVDNAEPPADDEASAIDVSRFASATRPTADARPSGLTAPAVRTT